MCLSGLLPGPAASADENVSGVAPDDLADGGGPGGAVAGGDLDGQAGEPGGEAVGGGAGEGRAPGAVGEAAGLPAGDGLLRRCGELLVEGVGDQPAQPVGDIDVAFGAQAPEAVAQGGVDAHLEDCITFHVMTS